MNQSNFMRPISFMNYDTRYLIGLCHIYSQIFVTIMTTCMSRSHDIHMIQKNHTIPRFQMRGYKIRNYVNSSINLCLRHHQNACKYVYQVIIIQNLPSDHLQFLWFGRELSRPLKIFTLQWRGSIFKSLDLIPSIDHVSLQLFQIPNFWYNHPIAS